MLQNQDENKMILLESVRTVFPHLKHFSDQQIERKLEAKRLDELISDFISYIQRDRLMMRNERLVEGVKLLKLVMYEMIEYQYPREAITPKSVLAKLSLLDDYFFRKQKQLEDGFPGYYHLFQN